MHTAKRGPRAAAAAPVSRPPRGARIRRTPLPNASPPLSVSPLPEDTRPHPPVHQTPARAHTRPRPGGTDVPRITQNTSRATYGSRVLSNMVSARAALRGRQTRHPFHESRPGASDGPELQLLPAREEQPRANRGRAALRRPAMAPGSPALAGPATSRSRPKHSRISRGSSAASGPPRSALACLQCSLAGSRRPLQQAGRLDSCFKDADR